jgi:diguanylate cyclase (GGDEF)-like protein
MFDIDHFKQINDTYGHLAGDHVLKGLASLIRSKIRREDVFARYGGEEFGVLLPGSITNACNSRKIQTVEAAEFKFEDAVIPVAISIGVRACVADRDASSSSNRQCASVRGEEGGRARGR